MVNYTENIVTLICQNLQLQPSSYNQATERYETICAIIQNNEAFNNIELNMYPQGSFRLKTTVKPLLQEEFDLDFVVEVPSDCAMTAKQLYGYIADILKNDGYHNNMVEMKARCVRISYKNDFHMDIMPGKVCNSSTHEILVPDFDLERDWYHHSNPIGYANWFENQAKTRIQNILNERNRIECSAEPIDDQVTAQALEPLRRAVQLVKRYRDIYCNQNNATPVRSIVLCTLMGKISSTYSDTLVILSDFCSYVMGLIDSSSGKPFEVRNPVVDEILTEKWVEDPTIYQSFVDMIRKLAADVLELRSLQINTEISEKLKEMFGESITQVAINEYARNIGDARNEGTLYVSGNGQLNTQGVGTVVRTNTFYGN